MMSQRHFTEERDGGHRLRPAPFFVTGASGLNHRWRTSAWSARKSSSDSRFHRSPSTVDQRLHVKQPFRRLPRLSISIRGCLHWLQQAILSASASITARSAFLRALASVSPLPPVTLRSVLPPGNLLGPGLPVILYGGQTFLAERNKH